MHCAYHTRDKFGNFLRFIYDRGIRFSLVSGRLTGRLISETKTPPRGGVCGAVPTHFIGLILKTTSSLNTGPHTSPNRLSPDADWRANKKNGDFLA
jgi:hypothetical protein